MSKIAVVGTEGCGKTVFITTLAKRLSVENSLGLFLNPQDIKTVQYVERAWQFLSNQDWPPSTPPGELFDLRWRAEWLGKQHCEVRLVDCAGQDLRLLFSNEEVSQPKALPGQLGELAEYVRSAEIVLLMVNLKDFVGEPNGERRAANEWGIKYALDYLTQQKSPKRFCLVFTQIDQYEEMLQQCGSWLDAAKTYLPYVYGAHLRTGKVEVLPVSAVYRTTVIVDSNGTPHRVPERDFPSQGLDALMAWVGQQVPSSVKGSSSIVDKPTTVKAKDHPLAVLSLVFGILSLCCCGVTGIAAIILGVIAMKKIAQSQGTYGGRNMATAGIILGLVSPALAMLWFLFVLVTSSLNR